MKQNGRLLLTKLITFCLLFPVSLLAELSSENSAASQIYVENWKVLSFPFDEIIDKAVILDSLNGWVWSNDKGHLYQYKQGKWYLTDYLSGIDYQLFFGYFNNYLWFLCRDVMNYRYFILLINENEQRRLYPPNADRIRDLCYLSDDNIWCGCEWGEILHFDGEIWKLFPSPTFMHIQSIQATGDNTFWIFCEAPNQYRTYFYDGNGWHKKSIKIFNFPILELYSIKGTDGNNLYFSIKSDDRLVRYIRGDFEEIDFLDITIDTLKLLMPHIKNPIIYHSSGSVTDFSEKRFYVKSLQQDNFFFYNIDENKAVDSHILTGDGYLRRIQMEYVNIIAKKKEYFISDIR